MSNEAHASLRERQQEATRREIAAAALDLFESQGFRGTTIDDIAREAGVSARTVFRHFATKNDLLVGWLPDLAVALRDLRLEGHDAASVLDEIEDAVAAAIVEYTASVGSNAAVALRRMERLYTADPDLQAAMVDWEARMLVAARSKLGGHLGDAADALTLELVIRLIAAPLLGAISTWGEGSTDTLAEHYQEARRRRDALVDGPHSAGPEPGRH